MTRLNRYIITAAAVLALPLTGCINDDALCPPDGADGDGPAVTLTFTVATRSASVTDDADAPARADDCIDDCIGTAAENFINTSDCQFMLFDKDRKLICPIFPTDIENNESLYSVKVTITDQHFEEAVMAAGQGGTVTFYIMVVANTRSADLNGQHLAYLPGTTTISELASQRKTFDLPPRRDAVGSPAPWSPSTDVTADRFIPMAGLQVFNIAASSLAAATETDPYELEDPINMLRSMAKIEVVDKIPVQEGLKVSNVELVGFNTEGTILPSIGTGGQWSGYITAQVAGVTMPTTDCYTKPVNYNPATYPAAGQDILRFFVDEPASTEYHDGAPVYSGYVTEYDQTRVAIDEVRPYIVVTLADGKGSTYYRSFVLGKYSEQGNLVGSGIEALLRNHIYRYEITGLTPDDVNITVNYTVCPWSVYDVDIPTFE